MAAKIYENAQVRRNFFLADFIYDALQKKARDTGVPMSQHVRDALIEYLKLEESK